MLEETTNQMMPTLFKSRLLEWGPSGRVFCPRGGTDGACIPGGTEESKHRCAVLSENLAGVCSSAELDQEQAGVGSPFVGSVPPGKFPRLSLNQRQEEKDSFLLCHGHPQMC